jgi:hypothetical protein
VYKVCNSMYVCMYVYVYVACMYECIVCVCRKVISISNTNKQQRSSTVLPIGQTVV